MAEMGSHVRRVVRRHQSVSCAVTRISRSWTREFYGDARRGQDDALLDVYGDCAWAGIVCAPMPNIASMHPYIVHAVIGFLVAGVLLRLISVTGKWSWSNQAAAALILAGTLAAVAAVRSGTDAHGPVEQIPGVRTAVGEHEEAGERARNIFLVIAAVELLALVIPTRQRPIRMVSAALGIAGLAFLYEAGEHGGDLVYSYAGGPGLRTGKPEDIGHLLRAGLYEQALQDRRAGRGADAGALIAEMARRWPDDVEVRLLRIESLYRDSHDANAALALIDSTSPPANDARLRRTLQLRRVYALLAAERKDSARTVLEQLIKDNPTIPRYKTLLDSIK